ncbi:MAG: kinesin motor protein cin8 [Phylliscum demangeonii]|nr:MAG: kinesin motor protein cin8 [Phylliscum demangeonii]
MAGASRPPAGTTNKRQPVPGRPPITRSVSTRLQPRIREQARVVSGARVLSGTLSPVESVSSRAITPRLLSPRSQKAGAGAKRKDRDYEQDMAEETSIHVVVRCRGRSEREVRENSGVVLATDGLKGRTLELSMGPNSLANKTYLFDRVFSPAADQSMIYEEVVTPMLDEMLRGFNCTIFAYGQTGTGKTYTMSGDMTDTLGLVSHSAGIIPRVLHSLFVRLGDEEGESVVKCSFIELYNEELRDLLSADESTKLKIFEDNNKKLQAATHVQGMEETYIKGAMEGIELLRTGNLRRQVAATKCNDLSSRSHTVFTVTAYVKRKMEGGEDYMSIGKLNLVDLAGSENIQRSGAENKRAAEAGLINKSLLTLGRVINALVDKSSHIPYRESKLTRLLQDSLGGHTKTCIIATVSSAKSNLEETVSTLDYAFRAKNIRNKPQLNQMISRKTLLREFTVELEKLKSELLMARQKNGVHLASETYDNLIGESESRRILSEEQKAELETMETALRNRVQELFTLSTNFNLLKKDNDGTRMILDETTSLLEQTEQMLAKTKENLAEESRLRCAHEQTEARLSHVGGELLSTLGQTVAAVDGLHSTVRRRADLHDQNRRTWQDFQKQLSDVTAVIKTRLDGLGEQQKEKFVALSEGVESFVRGQLETLGSSRLLLNDAGCGVDEIESQHAEQSSQAKEAMDRTLEEIKVIRDGVKTGVGQGLDQLSAAAGRITDDVVAELGKFQNELQVSYASLGQEVREMFGALFRHLNSQAMEMEAVQQKFVSASQRTAEAHEVASSRLDKLLADERAQAAIDRQQLLSQISSLVQASGEAQDARWTKQVASLQSEIHTSKETLESAQGHFQGGMEQWFTRQHDFMNEAMSSGKKLESWLNDDGANAAHQNVSIQVTTKTIQERTIQIVDAQMNDIHQQMQALDDFVTKARSQNQQQHDADASSIQRLVSKVKDSYSCTDAQLHTTSEATHLFRADLLHQTEPLLATWPRDLQEAHRPLDKLAARMSDAPFEEYLSTGQTPPKTVYQYPTTLPRTDARASLMAAAKRNDAPATVDHDGDGDDGVADGETHSKPPNAVFLDADADDGSTTSHPGEDCSGGLREVDVNVKAALVNSDPITCTASESMMPPPAKRRITSTGSKLPQMAGNKLPVIKVDGRENGVLRVFGGRGRHVS